MAHVTRQSTTTAGAHARRRALRESLAYCARKEHLLRTARIALVVGVILTSINQLDVVLAGHADAFTFFKCALNFVVPFVVSNLGLLGARHEQSDRSRLST